MKLRKIKPLQQQNLYYRLLPQHSVRRYTADIARMSRNTGVRRQYSDWRQEGIPSSIHYRGKRCFLFYSFKTGYECTTASCLMNTSRSFPRVKATETLLLTSFLVVVP